jgi:hypothetical protein
MKSVVVARAVSSGLVLLVAGCATVRCATPSQSLVAV